MALRFRPRHVQQTLYDHLEAQLTTLGWMTVGGFKSVPVNLQEQLPEEKPGVPVAANTVVLSLAGEDEQVEEELGAGLASVGMPVTVDIYGENQSIALSIAADVVDIWRGQVTGTARTLALYDYTSSPRQVVVDELIELEDVTRTKPPATDLRRFWQQVNATARVYHPPRDTP